MSAVETGRLLRLERVAALQSRLQDGSFDAARLESTPRARAEVLAQVLTRALSRGQMRRRLKRLGVSAEFCAGELLAISVEGGGLDVRGRNGRGQVLTGAEFDGALLAVFPELLPFTLRNLTLDCTSPIPGDWNTAGFNVPGTVFGPQTYPFSDDAIQAYNLSLFLKSYLASSVEANTDGASPALGWIDNPSIDTLFHDWSASGSVFGVFGPGWASWSAAGVNWTEINAEQAAAVVGTMTFSGTGRLAAFVIYNSPLWLARALTIRITYTNPPCATCSLTVQVNSACDGTIVDGGVLALSNGQSCTTAAGTCTIAGIPDGTHAYTFTKTGYTTLTGTFTCACAGGSATLTLLVTPVGGCPAQECAPLSFGPVRDLGLLVTAYSYGGGLTFGPVRDLALLIQRPHV